jgi:hypothetical protein
MPTPIINRTKKVFFEILKKLFIISGDMKKKMRQRNEKGR